MIKKEVRYDQRFDKIDVFIEDRADRSDYFRVSDFPQILTEGKNAFLINGTDVLDPGSPVKVQVIGPDGNYIWAQAIKGYLEGEVSRLVQIEVYPEQVNGPCKIIVIGKANRTLNGNPIPDEYQNAFNVRWTRTIQLDTDVKNTTTIRFAETPDLVTSEIRRPFIKRIYTGQDTQTLVGNSKNAIRVSGFYNQNSDNYELVSSNFDWLQRHADTGELFILGGDISYGGENEVTGSYRTKIKQIISNKYAIAETPFRTQQSDGTPAISAFGNSQFTLEFEGEKEFRLTENLRSFVNIDISNLETLSGDVDRVKVYQKSRGSIGEYQIIADQPLEAKELLIRDFEESGSTYTPKQTVGKFYGQDVVNNFWNLSVENYTGTVSFERDNRYLADALEISGAIDRSSDSRLIAKPNFDVDFKKDVSYQLATIPYAFKDTQGRVDLEVYMSGSAFIPSQGSKYGKLVLTASFDSTAQGKSKFFGDIENSFLADNNGEGRPVFVVKRGNWYLRNISLKQFTSTGFNPGFANFIIPSSDWSRDDEITYKAEFYDPKGNKADTEVFSSPTPITGSNTYLEGLDNLLSGSFFVGNEVGGGVSIAGYAGANIRSIGYDGFYSASNGGPGGFLLWSGSFLLTDTDGTTHPRFVSASQPIPYQGVGVEFHGGTDNGKPGHALSFDTITGQLSITGSINIANPGDVENQLNISTSSQAAISESLNDILSDQILTAVEKRQAREQIWRPIVSGAFPDITDSVNKWDPNEFTMLASPYNLYTQSFNELRNYFFDDTSTEFFGSQDETNPGWMAQTVIGEPFAFTGSTTESVDSRATFEALVEYYFNREADIREALVSASEEATYTNPQGKLVKPPQQSGEGLFLGSTNLGFYSQSMWQTYMDNTGQFYLTGSDGGGFLFWDPDPELLSIKGSVNITGGETRTEIDNIDTSISGALDRFDDIANDGLADESELPRFRDQLREIESEEPRLVSRATSLGIVNELNDYTASFNAFSSSLNDVLTAGSYPYDLSLTNYSASFAQYYDDRGDLIGTFGTQVSDDINARFNDIANDGLADQSELPRFQDFMDEINNEQTTLVNKANELGVVTEKNAYTASYQDFSSSLFSILTAGSYPFDLSTVNFRANYQSYYNDRGDLIGAFATQSEANAISYSQDDLADKLGYPNYSDLVASASAGDTLIDGGFINTDLIAANSIIAGQIAVGDLAAFSASIGNWDITQNTIESLVQGTEGTGMRFNSADPSIKMLAGDTTSSLSDVLTIQSDASLPTLGPSDRIYSASIGNIGDSFTNNQSYRDFYVSESISSTFNGFDGEAIALVSYNVTISNPDSQILFWTVTTQARSGSGAWEAIGIRNGTEADSGLTVSQSVDAVGYDEIRLKLNSTANLNAGTSISISINNIELEQYLPKMVLNRRGLFLASAPGKYLTLASAGGNLTTETTVTGGGSGSVEWGGIIGNINDQTDLKNQLDGKANLTGSVFTGLVEFDRGGSQDFVRFDATSAPNITSSFALRAVDISGSDRLRLRNVTSGATIVDFGANQTTRFGGDIFVDGDITFVGNVSDITTNNLQVEDRVIVVNISGSDALAQDAGFEVDRTSVRGSLKFDDTLDSYWKAGLSGSENPVLVSTSVLGTTNQVTVTDNGDGTITLNTPQNLHTAAQPTFSNITFNALTANRLVSTNGSKQLASVNLTNWIAGTTNQVNVADDGDGSVTLSLPQNIHTNANPTFADLTVDTLTANGTLLFNLGGEQTLSTGSQVQFNKVNIISSTTDQLILRNDTGNGNRIRFQDNTWQAAIYHDSGDLIFRTGGSTATEDRITIQQNGELTINGTTLFNLGGEQTLDTGSVVQFDRINIESAFPRLQLTDTDIPNTAEIQSTGGTIVLQSATTTEDVVISDGTNLNIFRAHGGGGVSIGTSSLEQVTGLNVNGDGKVRDRFIIRTNRPDQARLDFLHYDGVGDSFTTSSVYYDWIGTQPPSESWTAHGMFYTSGRSTFANHFFLNEDGEIYGGWVDTDYTNVSSLSAAGTFVVGDSAAIGFYDNEGHTLNVVSGTIQLKGQTFIGNSSTNQVRIEPGLIRMQDNLDAGRSLRVEATQLIASERNAGAYGYASGALLVSTGTGANTLLTDFGGEQSTDSRFQLELDATGNHPLLRLYNLDTNNYTLFADSANQQVSVGTSNTEGYTFKVDGNTLFTDSALLRANGSADIWLETDGGAGGERGWRDLSYGGGLYMSDTTWIRNVGNKGLYLSGSGVNEGTLLFENVVTTDDYTSGIFGAGAIIDNNATGGSFFEIDNMRVRNELRTHIFQKDIVKAANGYLLITDSAEVAETKTFTSGSSTTLDVDSTEGNATFDSGSLLWIKSINETGDTISVDGIKLSVISVDTSDPNFDRLSVDVINGGDVFEGDTVVRVSDGYILNDASTQFSPFIDIYDEVNTWDEFESADKLRSRFGNLQGKTTSTFGQLYGYGAWIGNLYAEGNARIAGTLTAGDNNGVGNTFYAGLIRKNLIEHSEDFGYNSWTLSGGATLATSLIASEENYAPDNESVADEISFDGTNNSHLRYTLSNPAANSQYTFSIFIKKTSGTFTTGSNGLRIEGGVTSIQTSSINSVGSGSWERLSVTATTDGTRNDIIAKLRSDDSGSLLIWGAQLEQEAFASNYQPTDGITLTDDNGYGMWANRGGIGGTIQNPVLELNDYGLIFNATATPSSSLTDNTIQLGNITGQASGAIKITRTGVDSNDGLYGYTSNGTLSFGLRLDGTAQIATFAFNDQYLTDGDVYIGNNLSSVNSSGNLLVGNYGDGTTPVVKVLGDNTNNFVQLFYTNNSDWGIRGEVDNNVVFELGSTNQIAGFTFTQDAFFNNNFFISGSAVNNEPFINSSDTFIVRANGDVTGSSVLFDGGTIGGFEIGPAIISSSNGDLILKANGQITASNALLSGEIVANTGSIGGFTITADALVGSNFFLSGSATGNETFINSNDAFIVRANGDITGSSVFFDGGTIASWTISAAKIQQTDGSLITEAGQPLFGFSDHVGFGVENGSQRIWMYFDKNDSEVKFEGGPNGSPIFQLGTTVNTIAGFNFTSTAITSPGNELELFSDGRISGSLVHFDGGTIGGFELTATQINSSNSNLVLKSTGQITGSDVLFDGGEIGGFVLETNEIRSSNNNLRLKANGDITGSSVLFDGGVIGGFDLTGTQFSTSNGNLVFKSNGDITGSAVLFDGGKIGGFDLLTNEIKSSNNNLRLKASGDITGSSVLFDGGVIGGWTIEPSTLTDITGGFGIALSGSGGGGEISMVSASEEVLTMAPNASLNVVTEADSVFNATDTNISLSDTNGSSFRQPIFDVGNSSGITTFIPAKIARYQYVLSGGTDSNSALSFEATIQGLSGSNWVDINEQNGLSDDLPFTFTGSIDTSTFSEIRLQLVANGSLSSGSGYSLFANDIEMTQYKTRMTINSDGIFLAVAPGVFLTLADSGGGNTGGGGSTAVTSVFGRTGDIIAQSGDYSADQVDAVSKANGGTFSGSVNIDGSLTMLNNGTINQVQSLQFNNTENASHTPTNGTVYYDQNVGNSDVVGTIDGTKGGLVIYNANEAEWSLLFDTNNMDSIDAVFRRLNLIDSTAQLDLASTWRVESAGTEFNITEIGVDAPLTIPAGGAVTSSRDFYVFNSQLIINNDVATRQVTGSAAFGMQGDFTLPQIDLVDDSNPIEINTWGFGFTQPASQYEAFILDTYGNGDGGSKHPAGAIRFELDGTSKRGDVVLYGGDGSSFVEVLRGNGINNSISIPGDLAITGSVNFGNTISVGDILLDNQTNLDVDTGIETIASVDSSIYDAVFFDYLISSGSNLRTGTVYTVHDGSSVEYTEVSTNDVGETTDVSLLADLSGGFVRLRADVASDNWSIKTFIRGI